MTPEDDDRTVIRPPSPPSPPGGFDKTEWSAGQGTGQDKTQIAAAPPPPHLDMGSGLPVGTRLGEFEVTSLLGEGGFGIVYLATDHSLQRRVALKEYMPSALAARTGGSQVQVKSERHRETFEAGRKSFINEARLLAQFDHPSLVKVYRFWEANGTAYMVMPFYEGKTLRDQLRAMTAKPDEAWLRTLLLPLTEALLVIHAEQCYHRDIAPDNVMMLAGSNRPLLLDFGAARRVIGDMTQALTVILKPGYAPVEQYAEIPGMKQGPWTDVYALAAVVYFAIMGRTPPPSVGRLLNDTYVPLVEAAAGRYSERFLSAVDRALAVRPEQRTQSIGELRSDLGLGEVVLESFSTQPLPVGTEVPPRGAAEPTQALTSMPAASAPAPRPAPAAAAPVASAPAAAAERKGSSALVGIGLGVVVLGALAVGGYALLAPKPPPAAPAAAPVPVAAAPAPAPVAATETAPPAAAPTSVPATVPAAPATYDVAQEFARVVQAQTPGFKVQLQTNKTRYRIDKDELSFTIQSDREGYVYVFMYGTDQVLMQLYPNIKHGSLKVKPGQSLSLPQLPDVFLTTAPTGATDLLVMVSPRQRDHSALRPKKDGAYRVFPTGAEAAGFAAQNPGPLPGIAGHVICPASGPCDDEFGAALVRVEVVP